MTRRMNVTLAWSNVGGRGDLTMTAKARKRVRWVSVWVRTANSPWTLVHRRILTPYHRKMDRWRAKHGLAPKWPQGPIGPDVGLTVWGTMTR